ncbi:hypothetical protein QBZ16_001660 [Prototheca wickerhamii]|uniref:argininosuccinate synthase n=1 Tax=Prototheca wickerhamii TaxID=3111 RepID=A0AAD9IG45_PROWI|nr:hypothetical protein QBZ16_001660 [Prototheca wickerhamii]
MQGLVARPLAAQRPAPLAGPAVPRRVAPAPVCARRSTAARAQGKSGKVNKVVLAYSGGLDTSVILKWLQETYDCEVVTFTADLGQGEELEPARQKAEAAGVKEIFIDDLREEFVRDYVFPMFRANSLYEGVYLLGTSIARPLIAKRQIEIARAVGADAVSHGATGKGNDQVRFELGYLGLQPDIRVIAPWREWDLNSRSRLIQYAESRGIAVPQGKRNEPPFSMDANLLHISYEGNALEDPWVEPSESMFTRSVSPETAPDAPTYVDIEFERGDPVAIDGVRLSPAALLTKLNQLGGANGIGRVDIVESRFVGMKSRGVYETPGGTVLLAARRALESITPRPRRGAPQGRAHAQVRRARLQRLLVLARAHRAAGAHRRDPKVCHGHRARQAVQGQHHRRRAQVALLPLRPKGRLLRGRRRRLRPARRRGLHRPPGTPPPHPGLPARQPALS